jgi:transposase
MAIGRDKFVDESGSNLATPRLFGRAPRGKRVVETAPQNYGPNVTRSGALSLQGLEAIMTVEGATNGDVFRAYVAQVLGPTLVAGDVVILDNLGAHKGAGIREAIGSRGAQVVYLPPYSPALSPFEPCWSKVKPALRTARARTREALESALVKALSPVTSTDARNWFTHGGYPVH